MWDSRVCSTYRWMRRCFSLLWRAHFRWARAVHLALLSHKTLPRPTPRWSTLSRRHSALGRWRISSGRSSDAFYSASACLRVSFQCAPIGVMYKSFFLTKNVDFFLFQSRCRLDSTNRTTRGVSSRREEIERVGHCHSNLCRRANVCLLPMFVCVCVICLFC